MAGHRERILEYLQGFPAGLDDDQLSEQLRIYPRQQVNQICGRLQKSGLLVRQSGAGRKIVNRLPLERSATIRQPAPELAHAGAAPTIALCDPLVPLASCEEARAFAYLGECGIGEDTVSEAVEAILVQQGWMVTARRGHQHGIDLFGTRGNERIVLEAKGEGSRPAMRVNYFLHVLGELLQRMDRATTQYGIALPAHKQLVALACRLPEHIRARLGLCWYFVRPEGTCYRVGYMPSPAASNIDPFGGAISVRIAEGMQRERYVDVQR